MLGKRPFGSEAVPSHHPGISRAFVLVLAIWTACVKANRRPAPRGLLRQEEGRGEHTVYDFDRFPQIAPDILSVIYACKEDKDHLPT